MSEHVQVTLLWSFAVFLASAFAGCIIAVTLTPKVKKSTLTLRWIGLGVVGFAVCAISYFIDLGNDLVGILGLSLLLCVCILPSYEETTQAKLFVGIMAALLANVITFMFCGTLDTFLGAAMGLFAGGTPYTVQNILLFIAIKVVVYTIAFFLYRRFMRKPVRSIIEITQGDMKSYLLAPLVSFVGFYVINLITNSTGIVPTNPWFLPLYLTICLIFVFEYLQIFNSVTWAAQAMKVEKEKERLGAELNVATQIQADMLPSIFPPFPDRHEFNIYAMMNPAKEVGGDFYDFFLVDDDHLAMVMADVSGKGVPAALFMVIAKTLIKNRAQMKGSPSEILMDVNNQLCEGNKAQLFVTVWLGILELSTGKGVAANAGHEHPVIRRAGGRFELVKYRHSPAVAALEGIPFGEHEFELHAGDTLFVYTDGVPEATDAQMEMYGTDRMLKLLNEHREASLESLLQALKKDIKHFVGDAPQFDDITMLALDYLGNGGGEHDRADA